MKVSVLTLGCKVNQAESSSIEAKLRTQGCSIAALKEKPDYCIINTCSVTSKSDYQSRQFIRRAHRAGSKIIVTGCYSELNKDAVRRMDGVMMVVDNSNKVNNINILAASGSCNTSDNVELARSRYFLKVQDGCNYSCSYCVIPKARGKSRSMKIDEVIAQINQVSHIYNEIVLTGIHLGIYGYDLLPKVKLSDLLKSILLYTSIRRIRLSSLEVNEIDNELIELIQDDRVCKHLHIPLQSGDDKILGIMNRNYNSKVFLDGFNYIYNRIPDISIGTDIIVGFPGEGEEEFENTRQFIEYLPFSYVHVFPYSVRKDTKAAEIGNGIESSVKKSRCTLIRALGTRKKIEYMQRQIGRILDPLIEKICDEDYVIGITGNYLKVKAFLNRPKLKSVVYVRIAEVKDDMLIGHPIEER